jgi:thiol oxidase
MEFEKVSFPTKYEHVVLNKWNIANTKIHSANIRSDDYNHYTGYIVSSRHVAVTLRNFIDYFFRCDVCRTNFLKMYDSCTHDHCTRLSDVQIPMKEEGQEELVLWLWEVHNAVNLRLMKEAAEREHREITSEEILSSKFPTRRMCHKCWLDVDQNHWNSSEIYKFLSTWYWPTDQDPYITSTMARNIHSTGTNGNPLSWSGFYLALIPFLYIVYLFAKEYMSRITMGWKWKQNKSQ